MNLLLIIFMLFAFLLVSGKTAKAELYFLEDEELFNNGEREGLVPSEAGLQLAKEGALFLKKGSFTSPIIEVEKKFSHLVASWNIENPKGTYATIEVNVGFGHQWTGWQILGEWGTALGSRSFSPSPSKGALAWRIDIDTFLANKGLLASHYQLKITLWSEEGLTSPILNGLGATAYQLADKKPLPKSPALNKELEVVKRSQMVEAEAIKNLICSPTCLTMVLDYWGHKEAVSSVAQKVYDHGAGIYGNWSFNVAYAGSLGYKAYVDHYQNLDSVKDRIKEGLAVIASIRYGQGELQNAPIEKTNGHLVLIVGFQEKDGQEYVIVNDPAAAKEEEVRREYLSHEFERAWRGIVYIIDGR